MALAACAQPSSDIEGDTGGEAEGEGETTSDVDQPDPALVERLYSLVLAEGAAPPADPTNAFADDPAAAALGQAFFFDPRFSGPLLSADNDGDPDTLGNRGETGRVSCAGCHEPEHGFADGRSTRGQLSLAAGWTHRRTPSLLDAAQATLLTWDGRRATGFSVVFGVIESPLEFNSSPLFVAQQIAAHYRDRYEAIFGPLPAALDAYEPLAAAEAGCTEMPDDPTLGCPGPGATDEDVTRVVANFGKAIDAYVRRLSCGPSRFDAWMMGDENALTEVEQAGAYLFVGRGACVDCHVGPYFSDQAFHNVGVPGSLVPFTGVDTSRDPGASRGLAAAQQDWLNPRGPFSDGDDGRLDGLPDDLAALEGAFRTPMLRCRADQRAYFHNGEFRSLRDVVSHFARGGSSTDGTIGVSELAPLHLTDDEIEQLVAFLEALAGPGPNADLLTPP